MVWAAVQPPRVEGGAWYAFRFEPGCDLLAVNLLMAAGVEVMIPKYQPDPDKPVRLALGCYGFARVDVASASWPAVPAILRECRAKLLGEDGEHPRPIPDAQIERLRRQLEREAGEAGEAGEAPQKVAKLAKGARVRVVGGLLGEALGEGVVEWANGREARVRFASGPLRIARPALEAID